MTSLFRALLAALLLTTTASADHGRFAGEVHSRNAEYGWDVTIQGVGPSRSGKMTGGGFSIRYDYSTLMREPITYQVGRYRVGTALRFDGLTIAAAAVSQPQLGPGGDWIDVPEAWMQDLRVLRFRPNLRFAVEHASWAAARDQNVGILGRPGEWGWDMSGSPNWDAVFECPVAIATHSTPCDTWARRTWIAVAKHHQGHGVHADFDPKDIVIDAGPLVSRILEQIPEALGALYPSRLATQAASLLRTLDRAYRRATTTSLREDPEVSRLVPALGRFFDTFGDQLPASLLARWRELRELPDALAAAERELNGISIDRTNRRDADSAHRLLARHAHLLPYSKRDARWTLLQRSNGDMLAKLAEEQRRAEEEARSYRFDNVPTIRLKVDRVR